jgi:hypothetical protein
VVRLARLQPVPGGHPDVGPDAADGGRLPSTRPDGADEHVPLAEVEACARVLAAWVVDELGA